MAGRRTSWRGRVIAVALLSTGCLGPGVSTRTSTVAPLPDGGGLSLDDEVCRRFFAAAPEGSERVENGVVTSPPQAVQHRQGARSLRRFGRWAARVEDPAIADRGERIAAEADRVLRTLHRNATDARAQELTKALYVETTHLYAECTRELYAQVLRGDRELTGACGEPGAPTLEGPNVIVYGGGGLEDSTCELLQGERHGDGCEFSGGGSASPTDGRAITTLEVAYDPDTCRALYESGHAAGRQP